MAFTASAIVECQTGGDDTNNGAIFDPGVAGFPTDGAATVATSGAPVFTSASYNFVAADVGAYVYIKSGTNWIAGWYQIASIVVSPNSATLTATIGSVVVAALSGTSLVAGCATTASPTGATWGIDYSRQAGSQITFTDMIIGGTTTQFTSTLKPVAKNYIGNSISVTSGTGFTVQRVVVASTSTITATCDKSLGTTASSGGNGRMGGAVASPSIASNLIGVAGMVGFCLNGTYSQTSNSTNTAGGALSFGNASSAFIGYSGANRFVGNTGTQPIVQINGSTFTLIQSSGFVFNITWDGNLQTAATLTNSATLILAGCSLINMTAASGPLLIGCLLTGNTGAHSGPLNIYCEAYANTASPFTGNANFKCLSYANTGATTDGFVGSCFECHSVANGRDGFRATAARTYLNCHAQSNAGWGFNESTAGLGRFFNCTGYNNSLGLINTAATIFQWGVSAASGDVYVDSANNKYSLNTLTGMGAALRNSGRILAIQTFPRGLTTPLFDIGGVQSRVPWQGGEFGG